MVRLPIVQKPFYAMMKETVSPLIGDTVFFIITSNLSSPFRSVMKAGWFAPQSAPKKTPPPNTHDKNNQINLLGVWSFRST